MPTLRDLNDRRARIVAEMRSITAQPAGAGGDLSEEQSTRFDVLKTELESVEKQVNRQALIDEAERRASGTPLSGTGDARLDNEMRSFSLVRAIASQVPNLTVDAGRERELSAEIARRSGRTFQGMAVPLSVFHQPIEQRVITSTSTPGAGAGGALIATDHLGGQYIDRLRAALVTRRLGARILSGLMGNVDIPKLKGSASTGWIAENSGLSPSDAEATKVSMTPRHVGSLTTFSRNMLLQSSPDIEQLVRGDFAAILAEAVDRAAIKGGGSNEPDGILETSDIGSVDMSTPSWSKVLEFIEQVEVDNAEGSAWATTPRAVRLMRATLKVSGDAGAGFLMDAPRELAGYPLASSNVVPSTLPDAASPPELTESALVFGNWSDLLVGYWSEFDLLVNPFESTAYAAGNILVRGLITCDVAVRHPESFAASVNVPRAA